MAVLQSNKTILLLSLILETHLVQIYNVGNRALFCLPQWESFLDKKFFIILYKWFNCTKSLDSVGLNWVLLNRSVHIGSFTFLKCLFLKMLFVRIHTWKRTRLNDIELCYWKKITVLQVTDRIVTIFILQWNETSKYKVSWEDCCYSHHKALWGLFSLWWMKNASAKKTNRSSGDVSSFLPCLKQ